MIIGNDIVKIALDTIQDEVDFAYESSDAKSRKDNTANTWQSGRSEFKKFTDLFPGDLAKNIVRHAARNEGIVLVDYDKIRTDNFQYNDKFDLSLDSKFFEVKSSIEKYTNSTSTLIDGRRFIVYPNREISDLIFQVFYVFENISGKTFFSDMEVLSDSAFKIKYTINSKTDFVEQFIQNSPNGWIMGFITKAMALKRKDEIFNFSNKSVQGDSSRKYIDFFIKDGIPFRDLRKYI